MAKLKVIDLFAGVGGLSYGFAHDEAFEIVAANEKDPQTARTYLLNHPTVKMYDCDITYFTATKIQEDLGISDIDIIVGGPPCQAYSTVGKRLITDYRGRLFQEYFRALKEFKPTLFLFENVSGLLSMVEGELLQTIISLFESFGYKVQYKLLNAADYGVPQTRERVIIVGSKLEKEFEYPKPTHAPPDMLSELFDNDLLPYLTVGEAIGDLPFIKTNEASSAYSSAPQNSFQELMRAGAPEMLMDHDSPNNNKRLVKIMELLPDGGTPEDLPLEIRPKSGYPNTYSRLWWNRPATTITRNLSTPSSSRCIHPKAPRPLTTREGARLQSFPDSYIFSGARGDKNLQIGNAVPPFLSKALAQAVKQHLSYNQV